MSVLDCRVICLLAAGLVAGLCVHPTELAAQQEEVAKSQAVIAFSIDAAKLLDHEVMQAQAVNNLFEIWQMNSPLADQISNIELIEGVVCLPNALSEIMEPPIEQPLPMDILVRIRFDNGSAADDMYSAIADAPAAEEIEVDGRVYIRPTDEMTNLRLHQLDQRTIEIATESFLMQDPWKLITPGLESAWAQLPDHAVRLAIDFEGRRDFVDEAVEMGKIMSTSMTGFIELANVIQDIRVHADLETDQLLGISLACKGEDEAEQVRAALDGALGILKLAPALPLGEIARSGGPEDAEIARQILDAMTATREGVQVQIMIPQPENFSDFLLRQMGDR